MNVPKDLKYSKEHEWVAVDGKTARIGITDYAQSQLGDIVYVDLPEAGTEITMEDPFGSIEAVKAVSDIFAPVSGTIREVNEVLADSPETINSSPYEEGWMVVVELSKPEEIDQLLTAEAYEGLTASEE